MILLYLWLDYWSLLMEGFNPPPGTEWSPYPKKRA